MIGDFEKLKLEDGNFIEIEIAEDNKILLIISDNIFESEVKLNKEEIRRLINRLHLFEAKLT